MVVNQSENYLKLHKTHLFPDFTFYISFKPANKAK